MNRWLRNSWWIVLMLLGFLVPLVITNSYYLQVILTSFIFAIAVYGLNIILGYTGQLSLAHAGFFGIGAYTVGLLTLQAHISFWLAIVAAALVSAVSGFLVGLVSLRTKGHYFAIFTMAVGLIVNLVIDKWDKLTNGQVGLVNIPPPNPIGPLKFTGNTALYYLIYVFLLVAIYVASAVKSSPAGRKFAAIHNSEELAQAVGINVMKEKQLSFILSTVFAGVAGGLFATYIGYLGPGSSNIQMTFNMLLYLLVGGIGSIAGPLLGSLIVTFFTEFLQVIQNYQMIVFGPILVILIIFFPRGLAGIPRMFQRMGFMSNRRTKQQASQASIQGGSHDGTDASSDA